MRTIGFCRFLSYVRECDCLSCHGQLSWQFPSLSPVRFVPFVANWSVLPVSFCAFARYTR